MGLPRSCKECANKIRRFCRQNNVGRGSNICDLAQSKKWSDIKQKIG
jgi:hypothetical protein